MFVPLGILVQSAFQSVQRERAERHAAVAERVFDEMERELKRIVQREEARHFSHYRFFFVPEADSLGRYVVARSPLSEFSPDPFVLGHFQIDPDDSVNSPMIPRDTGLGRALTEWTHTLDRERAVRSVDRIVRLGLQPERRETGTHRSRSSESLKNSSSVDPIFTATPGTTRQVPLSMAGGGDRTPVELSEKEGGNSVGNEDSDATFDALRSLNRAGQPRSLAIRLSRGRDGATIEFRDMALGQRTILERGASASPGRSIFVGDISAPGVDHGAQLGRHFDVDEALRNRRPGVLPVGLYTMKG